MKRIKIIIHALINVTEAFILHLLGLLPGRVKRRIILLEEIRQNYKIDNQTQLSYFTFGIPNKPSTEIKCYVHPQDIRAGWILDRMDGDRQNRPDRLLGFCRNALEQFQQLTVLIDLGANYGEYYACSKELCNYVAVEPNPLINKLLRTTAPNSILYETAIIPQHYDGNDFVLNINPFYSGGSSLLKKTVGGLDRGISSGFDQSHILGLPVSVMHVTDVIDTHVSQDTGYYLKVDIEGVDSQIVKDAIIHSHSQKSIIQMELNEEDLSSSLSCLNEICDSEFSNNYRFIRLFDGVDNEILETLGGHQIDLKEYFLKISSPLSMLNECLSTASVKHKGYNFGELVIFNECLLEKNNW